MKAAVVALGFFLFCPRAALAAEPPSPAPASSPAPTAPEEIKPPAIKPKRKLFSHGGGSHEGSGLLQPDTDVIDAPTTAVLDYGGFSAKSRFFARGGLLQYISFGVYQGVNLGGSLTVDGLVGNERIVRVRAPSVQFKWRFYDGEKHFPSLALGYDGQGFLYNQDDKRYNHRQRGVYVVASQEVGIPGLLVHPGMNISDFDSNDIYGTIPISLNIRDKVSLLWEWDNIHNFYDSRVNTGLRVYVTSGFHVDFALRGIGQGGAFPDGQRRGPERIVHLKYSGSF